MSKKIISVVLAVMLMVSMISVAMISVSATVDEDGRYVPSEGTETNRYYFYMPEDWTNEFTSKAGVYWWAGTDNCQALGEDTGAPWPGYGMHQGDAANIWYVDVPKDVDTIIFNNALDGTAPAAENFDAAKHAAATQSQDIGCQWYDPGEDDNYPEGVSSFDNMIWVPNSEPSSTDDYGQRKFGGEWYYYHGNGVYDFNKEPEETEPQTDPSQETTAPVEDTTAAPVVDTTAAPVVDTTAAPVVDTTAAPASKSMTVTATSNIANAVLQTYNEENKTVTVTYYLKTDKKILCGDWFLTYDPAVLKVTKANNVNEDGDVAVMPVIDARGGGSANLFYDTDKIYGSFTTDKLYDFTKGELKDNVFVNVTFDIIGDYTQDTTVNLDVQILTAGVRVEDSDTEAHVDQFDYIANSALTDMFKAESQTNGELNGGVTIEETTAPTEETTVPSVKSFKVTANSNIAEPVSEVYSEADKTVTVTYYLQTAKKILCGDWTLTYDPSILKVTKANNVNEDGDVAVMPIIDARGGGSANLNYDTNKVYGSFTSDKLYDFTKGELTDNVFVTVVFDIVGDYTQDTTIDLDVKILTAGVRVEDSETEAHVDQYDYIANSELTDLFKQECKALATLSAPVPVVTDTQPPESEPTTLAPGNDFVVTAKSNIADTKASRYTENVDKTVTINFYLTAAQTIGAGEWTLTYDPAILKLAEDADLMPYIGETGSAVNTKFEENQVYGSFTNIPAGYDFTTEQILVQAKFDIVGDYTQDTEVVLYVDNLAAIKGTSADEYELVDYIRDGVPTDLFNEECSSRIAFLDGTPVDVTVETTVPPTEEPTGEPTEEPTTAAPTVVAPTNPTSSVATPDTTPTATSGTTTTGNGTVKTSDSPVAFMLLALLAAATGFIIVVRKRELDK